MREQVRHSLICTGTSPEKLDYFGFFMLKINIVGEQHILKQSLGIRLDHVRSCSYNFINLQVSQEQKRKLLRRNEMRASLTTRCQWLSKSKCEVESTVTGTLNISPFYIIRYIQIFCRNYQIISQYLRQQILPTYNKSVPYNIKINIT